MSGLAARRRFSNAPKAGHSPPAATPSRSLAAPAQNLTLRRVAVIIQALTNKMRHTSFYDIKEGKLIHYLSSGAGKNARCVSIETEYRYPPKLTEQEQLELESKLMEQSWPGH